jgi:hypothetical protein
MRNVLLALSVVAALLLAPGAVQAREIVEVNECGQHVYGWGALAGDLDCPDSGYPAVVITGRGGLLLNGFTISGGRSGGALVRCWSRCTILGPGTITGEGTAVGGSGPIKIRDVTLTAALGGVLVSNAEGTGKLVMQNCAITGALVAGVSADARVKLADTSITGSGRWGVAVGYPNPWTGEPCAAGRLRMRNSIVTGNGLICDPASGSTNCADIITCGRPPRLSRSSACETSCIGGTGVPCESWGVCSSD